MKAFCSRFRLPFVQVILIMIGNFLLFVFAVEPILVVPDDGLIHSAAKSIRQQVCEFIRRLGVSGPKSCFHDVCVCIPGQCKLNPVIGIPAIAHRCYNASTRECAATYHVWHSPPCTNTCEILPTTLCLCFARRTCGHVKRRSANRISPNPSATIPQTVVLVTNIMSGSIPPLAKWCAPSFITGYALEVESSTFGGGRERRRRRSGTGIGRAGGVRGALQGRDTLIKTSL